MGKIKFVLAIAMPALLFSCADAPVEYNADSTGGTFHSISTDPAEIFRNKVDHEAALEVRGVEPPVGNASWREYWTKLIAYYSAQNDFGTHRQIVAYIAQQRSARGLSPL
jgi:hypothetical protein